MLLAEYRSAVKSFPSDVPRSTHRATEDDASWTTAVSDTSKGWRGGSSH